MDKNQQPSQRPASAGTGSPSPGAKPSQPSQTNTNAAKAPAPKKRLPSWLRITLRIMRTLLVPFLLLAALIAGVMIGYGYVGGRSYSDVWNLETWKHLFELVFAN